MEAPDEIKQLVEKFREHRDEYRSQQYNEENVRIDFINPFFQALGWDIRNEMGIVFAYRDVIHEEFLRLGDWGGSAPDYTFRIGNERKFFVEAKKPSENLQTNRHHVYQLRRYGWSAKLPISILTDFEELVVYETTSRPKENDSPVSHRVMNLTFEDYLTHWEEIHTLFSREAVENGSLEKFAKEKKLRRGTSTIDKEFLKEIESWRNTLAVAIAANNEVSVKELNYAVQKIIDRIIFLRVCEDRGLESYGKLQGLQNQPNIYEGLLDLFYQADEKYNSGLFHFSTGQSDSELADRLTPRLTVPNETLKDILKNLYFPESPFVFEALPQEILGQVYEQFLGKVIQLDGNNAVVEEKPEVRKAGGVYYTPQYIIEYIVEQTVGKLVDGKTPKQVEKLRIMDTACGSGSFPLGAYTYLLDWHRDWYMQNDPQKWSRGRNPSVYQAGKDDYRLTLAEKKKILLNNIYGVDIDYQAVEVTKLTLLLKLLEGERQQFFTDRGILPSLSKNIKCGNSLIGTDYYTGQTTMESEEVEKVNPFDWETEFAEIFSLGGFDAVIGNPPWGAEFNSSEQIYLQNKYLSAKTRSIESYSIFFDVAINICKRKGLIGYITPDTFLRKDDLYNIRKSLLMNTCIYELIETGPLFSAVRDTWCLIGLYCKDTEGTRNKISHKKISRYVVSVEERLEQFGKRVWDIETQSRQSWWINRPQMVIGYLTSEKEQKIVNKMENCKRLSELSSSYLISRGEEGSKFNIRFTDDGDYIMLIPENIERNYIHYGELVNSSSLTRTKKEKYYSHPKIWIIRIQKMRWKQRIVSAYDNKGNTGGMKTLQIIVSPNDNELDLKYLSAILSSSAINYWCVNYLIDDINQTYLGKLPIPFPENREKLVLFLSKIIELNITLNNLQTEQEKTLVKRQIEVINREIDKMIYELYELTSEEIAVVEGVNRE